MADTSVIVILGIVLNLPTNDAVKNRIPARARMNQLKGAIVYMD